MGLVLILGACSDEFVMKYVLVCLVFLWGSSACVEDQEEVVAYEYDPARLCVVDANSPVVLAHREPRQRNRLLFVSPTCSFNQERRLVSFQTYFSEGFVDCSGIWEEVVYWEEVPGRTSISDLECQD